MLPSLAVVNVPLKSALIAQYMISLIFSVCHKIQILKLLIYQ